LDTIKAPTKEKGNAAALKKKLKQKRRRKCSSSNKSKRKMCTHRKIHDWIEFMNISIFYCTPPKPPQQDLKPFMKICC
jgi:hypothetical protein